MKRHRKGETGMKKLRFLAFTISLVLIIGELSAIPCSATGPWSKWDDTDSANFVIIDEDSPIVIEKEILTLDLYDFPDYSSDSVDDYLSYTGKITEEYHLYNPSDQTVTATILLPFGKSPIYSCLYDDDGNRIIDKDAEKYSIKVNGEPVDADIRHSYYNEYKSWTEYIAPYRTHYSIEDEYTTCDEYSPDTVVTAFTYAVSGIDDNYPSATAEMLVPKNSGIKGRFYLPDQTYNFYDGDGARHVGIEARNGESFTVYLVGGEATELFPWSIYANNSKEDSGPIAGQATLAKIETITFRDMALTKWTSSCGISKMDWYNAFTHQFRHWWDDTYYYLLQFDLSDKLFCWYEYEITLKPGERVIHTVTAPIYPIVNEDYAPTMYTYVHNFGATKIEELEVYINTPYLVVQKDFSWLSIRYSTDSRLGEYEKTDRGYHIHVEGPPRDNLTFTLSESEDPRNKGELAFGRLLFVFSSVYFLNLIFVFSAIAVVAVLVVKAIKKRRANRKNNPIIKNG